MPRPPTDVPPALVRRYRPERVISSGGFGTVWVVTELALNRSVALKVLHPELLGDDVQVQRFLNEARITSFLAHPNIVQLYDHGIAAEVPWIAYEYVAGENLRERMSGAAVPWAEACRIGADIAAALAFAHVRNVLHRDIKPDNIIRSTAGQTKVADFGLAKRTTEGLDLTAEGIVVGTPAYMAPSQIRGEPPGPDVDLYALGILLFEMLAGRLPFAGTSAMEMFKHHLRTEVPLPSSVTPDVPREVDELVLRLLAKTVTPEMPTAREVRRVLRAALGDRGPLALSRASMVVQRPLVLGHTTTEAEPAADPTAEAPPAAHPPAPLSSASVRRAAGSLALITALAAAAVAGLAARFSCELAGPSPAPAVAPLLAEWCAPPAFVAPQTIVVTPRGIWPRGALVELVDENGRRIARTGRAAAADQSVAVRIERAPREAHCVLRLVSDDGTLRGRPYSVDTPAPLRLDQLSIAVAPTSVRVSFTRRDAGPLDLQLGRGTPPLWLEADRIAANELTAKHTLENLEPNQSFWLRITAPGRWGGLAPYAVRTPAAGQGEQVLVAPTSPPVLSLEESKALSGEEGAALMGLWFAQTTDRERRAKLRHALMIEPSPDACRTMGEPTAGDRADPSAMAERAFLGCDRADLLEWNEGAASTARESWSLPPDQGAVRTGVRLVAGESVEIAARPGGLHYSLGLVRGQLGDTPQRVLATGEAELVLHRAATPWESLASAGARYEVSIKR